MSTPPVVVGVDIGSSASRALALGRDGTVYRRAVVAHQVAPSPVVGEVDPVTWRTSAIEAIGRVGGSASAIGVGGYGPTTVASNGELALTFRYPVGDIGDPHDQHRAHASILDDRCAAGTAPRLLWDWMIGELGAGAGFQSVWPGDDPIEGFGTPVAVGTAVAESSAGMGIEAGIPLVPSTNDGYLTAWAAGIDVPGRGFDPGGRTGGLGVAVADVGPAAPYGIPSAVRGVVIAGGPTASHGAMLEWWSATSGTDVDDLLVLAEGAPAGSDGVLVLPYLEGERAPRWNPGLTADIVGLRPHHGLGTIARAILESTAYGLAHIAESLAAQGVVLERLVACGSTSRSPLWVSIKSSVLGVPVDVPVEPEMAAYGAALAAGSALGWWPRPGEGSPGDWPLPQMTTTETPPESIHEARFHEFVRLGDAAEARAEVTSSRAVIGDA